MSRKACILFIIYILILFSSACTAQSTQLQPTSVLTQASEPVLTPSTSKLPSTEAEVPRVPVEQAKVAIDGGAAIVVDVRTSPAYEASHVKGAINIPLADIETNPTGLKLSKDQWIITYCT